MHHRKSIRRRLGALLRLWFSPRARVSRQAYWWSGIGLGLVKAVGDAVGFTALSGQFSMSFNLFRPFSKALLLLVEPSSMEHVLVVVALLVWTVVFLGIGLSMTARRARDAGLTPFLALLLLMPLVNFAVFLALCRARSAEGRGADRPEPVVRRAHLASGLKAIGLGVLVGGVFFVAAILVGWPYGSGLFVGAPFVVGVVTAFCWEWRQTKSVSSSQLCVQLALLGSAGILLIIAVEGLICVLMAYPIAALFAACGGSVGHLLAVRRSLSRVDGLLVLVLAPLLTAAGGPLPERPLRSTVTSVVIEAPPEVVWPHVVAFAELAPPEELVFRAGIAYPIGARIEGEGVGAVRYCEFSTGAFVEPITHWQEPIRLAFDVVEQPPTMTELSPYDIHPQHLTESFVFERGEFRLTPMSGGRTRLQGTTWYRHDLGPELYWNLWTDALIHRIHSRVLRHIGALSEEAMKATTAASAGLISSHSGDPQMTRERS